MVLKEIEHSVAYAVHCLPASRELGCRPPVCLYPHKLVIEVNLVVEIVETSIVKERAVKSHIIDFANKHHMGVKRLHLWNGPMPEGQRNHKHHVASETVDTLRRPETQYAQHLEPCVGNW